MAQCLILTKKNKPNIYYLGYMHIYYLSLFSIYHTNLSKLHFSIYSVFTALKHSRRTMDNTYTLTFESHNFTQQKKIIQRKCNQNKSNYTLIHFNLIVDNEFSLTFCFSICLCFYVNTIIISLHVFHK